MAQPKAGTDESPFAGQGPRGLDGSSGNRSSTSLDLGTYPIIYPEPSLRGALKLATGLSPLLSSSFSETPPSSFSYSSNPLPSSSGISFALFKPAPEPESIAVPVKCSQSSGPSQIAGSSSQCSSQQRAEEPQQQQQQHQHEQQQQQPSCKGNDEAVGTQVEDQQQQHHKQQKDEQEQKPGQRKDSNAKDQQQRHHRRRKQTRQGQVVGPDEQKGEPQQQEQQQQQQQQQVHAAARALRQMDLPGGYSRPPHRPMLGEVECSCPMICLLELHKGMWRAVPLPTTSLQYKVYCHISQVFVDLQLLCTYPEDWQESQLAFFMPKALDTTITDASIHNLTRPSILATTMVPRDGAGMLQEMQRPGKGSQERMAAPQDPGLFYLEMPEGYPGDQYRVQLHFFQGMLFEKGQYVSRLPARLHYLHLLRQQGISPNSLVGVEVTINTGLQQPVEHSCNQPTALVTSQPGCVAFKSDDSAAWASSDFVFGYRVWGSRLRATLHVQPPLSADHPEVLASGLRDLRGTVCLSITPPAPEASSPFPRAVVFLLDRSSSMVGEPLACAKKALAKGLELLEPQDQFAVVALNQEQLWWSCSSSSSSGGGAGQAGQRLAPATRQNVQECVQWVLSKEVCARGSTDLVLPLYQSLQLLEEAAAAAAGALPCVFIITDGCVEHERDICETVGSRVRDFQGTGHSPRIFTFGIGPFCNHYFLKQLSLQGRGMFDVALTAYGIQAQMEGLLLAAALPLLADVQLAVPAGVELELYPQVLPDVYCGQPLLVVGKYKGEWPQQEVEVKGLLPTGEVWSASLPALPAGGLPLHKVFAKAVLDVLAAAAWQQGEPRELVQQLVDLSLAAGVPSPYTCTVGFETTPKQWQQMQALPRAQQRRLKVVVQWALRGALGLGVVGGVSAAMALGTLLVETPVALLLTGSGSALPAAAAGAAEGGAACCWGCEGGCGDCCVIS